MKIPRYVNHYGFMIPNEEGDYNKYEITKNIIEILHDLYQACIAADEGGELSDRIDGELLDRVKSILGG